jgi:hypothetical protein
LAKCPKISILPDGCFAANRKPWSPAKQALVPEKSAASRDQLLGELTRLGSREEAAAWAQRALFAKNTLTTVDFGLVELHSQRNWRDLRTAN